MSRLDTIDDLRVFDAIARSGSLSAAARDLAVSLTLVSKKLKRLEDGLGVRLVQRTTRQLQLTDDGHRFLERCRAVLSAVEAAEEFSAEDTVRGVVRVTAGIAFANRQIAPRLPHFLDLHPEITVQIISCERVVDLVEQKVDVAFRQMPVAESSFITRTIAPDGRILVASPDYLARFGMPGQPDDLAGHRLVAIGDPPPLRWPLWNGDQHVVVPLRPIASGNDGEMVHATVLAGGGIAIKASWDVLDDVRAGRLVRVLPAWWGETRGIRVVHPVRAHQPLRVKTFVDYMEAELKASARRNADLGLFPQIARSSAALASNDDGEPVSARS